MAELGFFAALMALSWYWLVPIGIVTVLVILAGWNDEPAGGVGVAVLIGLLLYLIPDAFAGIVSNPFMLITLVLIYVVVGVVWSFFKWYKKLIYLRDERKVKSIPQAGDYKCEIICWASYWPLGIIKYVLGDLIQDLFESIWKRFNGGYQRIANKVFAPKPVKAPTDEV